MKTTIKSYHYKKLQFKFYYEQRTTYKALMIKISIGRHSETIPFKTLSCYMKDIRVFILKNILS